MANAIVIDYIWKTSTDTIGIVLVRDVYTKKYKAYIGVGNGQDEKSDIAKISSWGAKLSLEEAKGFFPRKDDLITENYSL